MQVYGHGNPCGRIGSGHEHGPYFKTQVAVDIESFQVGVYRGIHNIQGIKQKKINNRVIFIFSELVPVGDKTILVIGLYKGLQRCRDCCSTVYPALTWRRTSDRDR